MKRRLRRTVAILVGLCLGWIVAGPPSPWDGGDHALWGAVDGGSRHAAAGVSPASAASGAGGSSEGGAPDKAADAARELVPAAGDVTWYPWILLVAVGLFVAAIAFGRHGQATGGDQAPDQAAH